jgi:hypothetical protein
MEFAKIKNITKRSNQLKTKKSDLIENYLLPLSQVEKKVADLSFNIKDE